jgi:glycosyltransferase involved in cell wall biosynthesis
MRIAIVSPLFESVPPRLYGGTERVVSYLTEELVRQGHQVTLFASGDSRTNASLRPVTRRGLRLDPDCQDTLAYHVIMLDEVIESASEFDVIHFNIDYWHFPLSKWLGLPSVTTLHGRLDLPDLVPLYARFRRRHGRARARFTSCRRASDSRFIPNGRVSASITRSFRNAWPACRSAIFASAMRWSTCRSSAINGTSGSMS